MQDFIIVSNLCPVSKQNKLPICSSLVIANQLSNGTTNKQYSSLFIHYNSENDYSLLSAIKSLYTYGACLEQHWVSKKFNYLIQPSIDAYRYAQSITLPSYKQIYLIEEIENAILDENTVACGMTTYAYFHTSAMASCGVLKLPSKKEAIIGHHSVEIVGYSRTKGMFLVKNSWGKHWGKNGYFLMPYEYLSDIHHVQGLYTKY